MMALDVFFDAWFPRKDARGFYQWTMVPLQQLRELGQYLVDIHGQHEPSLYGRIPTASWSSDCGRLQTLVQEVRQLFAQWQQASQNWIRSLNVSREHESQVQLLTYQVEELDSLSLGEDELQILETEQQQIANAESILRTLGLYMTST